jgi:hypothetical protein
MPGRKRSRVVIESDDEGSTAKEIAPVASGRTRESSSEGNKTCHIFSMF